MEKRYLMHLFTAMDNPSPFDVNMAYDAGWDALTSYTHVGLDDVTALVQDAIFSRGPKGAKRTGIFIGGRDAGLALDMLDTAREAMVPPFEVGVCADPSGAFTTSAALVARVEHWLGKAHQGTLEGARVVLVGGTGPVGVTSAVLAAEAGAEVKIASHQGLKTAQDVASVYAQRFGVKLQGADSSGDEQKRDLVADADVILATAKAGIQVISAEHLAAAGSLKVAADVNAVPPAGVEGIDAQDDGKALQCASGAAIGVGALAVGNVKYRVQQELLRRMRDSDEPLYLDFRDAFQIAREQVQ